MEIDINRQMAASLLPLPKNFEKCKTISSDVARNAQDSGSIGLGILLMIAGFVFFVSMPFVMSDNFDTGMLLGVVVFFATFFWGLRIILKTSFKVAPAIKEFVAQYLQPDEEFIACSPATKAGMSLWLTGISKQGYVVFTSHRLLLITLNGKAMGMKTMQYFVKKGTLDEIIHEIFVADYSDKNQVSYGGLLFPPVLHIAGKRISIKPEGKDSFSTWALMCLGTNNGKVIKEIFSRRSLA